MPLHSADSSQEEAFFERVQSVLERVATSAVLLVHPIRLPCLSQKGNRTGSHAWRLPGLWLLDGTKLGIELGNGVSARGSIALMRAAQAIACIQR